MGGRERPLWGTRRDGEGREGSWAGPRELSEAARVWGGDGRSAVAPPWGMSWRGRQPGHLQEGWLPGVGSREGRVSFYAGGRAAVRARGLWGCGLRLPAVGNVGAEVGGGSGLWGARLRCGRGGLRGARMRGGGRGGGLPAVEAPCFLGLEGSAASCVLGRPVGEDALRPEGAGLERMAANQGVGGSEGEAPGCLGWR